MTPTAFTVGPATHEVVVTRIFDAPREAVYAALTDPEAIPRWWGPRRNQGFIHERSLGSFQIPHWLTRGIGAAAWAAAAVVEVMPGTHRPGTIGPPAEDACAGSA